MLYFTILSYIAFYYYIVLLYSILYCTKWFFIVAFCTVLRLTPVLNYTHCALLLYTILSYIISYYIMPCCTVLHYTRLNYAILHYITVYYTVFFVILQCAMPHYRGLPRISEYFQRHPEVFFGPSVFLEAWGTEANKPQFSWKGVVFWHWSPRPPKNTWPKTHFVIPLIFARASVGWSSDVE